MCRDLQTVTGDRKACSSPSRCFLKVFSCQKNILSLVLSSLARTNSDLSLRPNEINLDRDRPYAGWIYASLFFEAETIHDRYIKHEFSLGCVGPCSQAEEVQTEWQRP